MASKTYWDMFVDIVDQVWFTNTFNDWENETRRIKRDINQIQKEVLSISKTYLKKAWIVISWWTVADQANYPIPTWVDKVSVIKITVWDTDYYPEEISIWEYHRLTRNTDNTSDISSYFTIDKDEIFIYPTPASSSNTIEVNASQYATDLSTDPGATTDQNTNLEIKEWYENVIYYYALHMAYMRLEDVWLADRYEIKHEKLLDKYKWEVSNPTNSILVSSWYRRPSNPNDYTVFT